MITFPKTILALAFAAAFVATVAAPIHAASAAEPPNPDRHARNALVDNALVDNALVDNAVHPNAIAPNAVSPNAVQPNAIAPSTNRVILNGSVIAIDF